MTKQNPYHLGYGPVIGTPRMLTRAQFNAATPKVTSDDVWDNVSGYEHPYMPNWMLQDKPPRSIEALVTPMMKLEDKQFRGTSANSYFPQPEKIEATGASPNRPAANAGAAGAVPSQPNQAAANASAAGNNMSRQSITIAGREWPLVGKPGTFERVPVKGGGMAFIGYTGGDDTRNFQYAIRHEPVRRRSAQQAQPQQPRGLHYVPGGWANDGYSFEGSAEDRARFFAPVPRPYNHAPRSDNDTFLALQRQKAMQPVEQPLPERPEFPADKRMGWHTKLAKYQEDMRAYNQQMADIAGYRRAMDVAALQQARQADPIEQARLGFQMEQAAQQTALQRAQLDQQNQQFAYQREQDAIKNALGVPAYRQAQLGAAQAEDVAALRREYAQAARRGDKATMAQLESIIKMYGRGSDENSRKKDSPQFIPGKMNDDGSITPDRIFDPETREVFSVPQQQAWSPDELNEAADNQKVIQAAIDRTGGKVGAELASALRAANGDPRLLRELRARVDQLQK